MQQGGTETAGRFLKCCAIQRTFACTCQVVDQSPLVSERSSFEQMVRDVSRALIDGIGIERLDRIGDGSVQPLLAWGRDAGKQGLTHKFVAEGKRPLWAFGARHDYSHLLGFFDDGKKLVNVYLADLAEQLKTETAPDDRGSGQHAFFVR